MEFDALLILIGILVAVIWYLFSFKFAKIGKGIKKATQQFNPGEDKSNADKNNKSNESL